MKKLINITLVSLFLMVAGSALADCTCDYPFQVTPEQAQQLCPNTKNCPKQDGYFCTCPADTKLTTEQVDILCPDANECG